VTSVIETPGNRTAHEKTIFTADKRGWARIKNKLATEAQRHGENRRLQKLPALPKSPRSRMATREFNRRTPWLEIGTFSFPSKTSTYKVPNREKSWRIMRTVLKKGFSVSAGLVVCTAVAIRKRTYIGSLPLEVRR